jgi:hypothetical protein
LPAKPTMPRIQFTLPDRFTFATDMQIYISHVNQGGHLDNAQLLTLVSEARVRFFKTLGYTEGNVDARWRGARSASCSLTRPPERSRLCRRRFWRR